MIIPGAGTACNNATWTTAYACSAEKPGILPKRAQNHQPLQPEPIPQSWNYRSPSWRRRKKIEQPPTPCTPQGLCLISSCTIVLGKFGLVQSRAIFAGLETGWSSPQCNFWDQDWDCLEPSKSVWFWSRPSPDSDQLKYAPFVAQNPWANGEGLRAGVQSRSAWVGVIKGGWHVHTVLGGLVVGGWWNMKGDGM